MAKPDTSEVTPEEFEALFNEDGPLEEEAEADDEESGEESEENEGDQEEEAEASAQDEEEGDDAESEDEEEPEATNWEEAPEALRTEHESVKAERDRWKRDYGKLQSRFTERSNAFKEEEKSLPMLRQKAQALDGWNNLLGRHPHLQQVIERELARATNPLSMVEVPKGMENDPAVQYFQKALGPIMQYTRQLEQQIAATAAKAGKVDEWENEKVEDANRRQLNALIDQARGEVKTMFGRDATDDEIDQVLRYMTENEMFHKTAGKAAVRDLFFDKYSKLSARTAAEKAKEKAKKFPVRKKGIAPAGGKSKDAQTPEEALAMAFADQGFGT